MQNHVTSKIVLATSLAIALIAVILAASAWYIDEQRTGDNVSSYRALAALRLNGSGDPLSASSLPSVRAAITAALPHGLIARNVVIRTDTGKTIDTESAAPPAHSADEPDEAPDESLTFNPAPWISPAPSTFHAVSTVLWASPGKRPVAETADIDIDSSAWKRSDGALLFKVFNSLFVLTILLVIWLRHLVHAWVSRPAAAIIRVAHRIAAGDQDLRLAITAQDEFGKIMKAFNDLTDALLTTQQEADTDGLTQLFNHRYLQEKLGEALVVANKSGGSMAIILIDLDRFKLLNDTYGHLIGDRFLQQTAAVLRRAIHLDGIVGRYGGDEFVVVLPRASKERARAAARRIRQLMDQEKFRPNSTSETLPMGFSLGVAVYPDDGKSAHDLIAYADATLYTEKSGGLHLVQFTRDIETEYAVAHPSNARTPHNGLFATLFSLVVAIDKKDRYTKRHSEHVALWSAHLATARGLPDITVSALKVAGLLHDVGKIGIPDSILRKPGPLSADEYEIMKGHVALSERLIQDVPYQREVLEAVACHHERWDGRGYPRGLKGDEMPITGRIMALIDAYSAMSLDRPYRRAKSFDEICEQLRSGAGTQFDATLVEPFIELLATYGNKHADDNDAEIETLRSWSTSPTPSARAVSNG